MVKPKFVSSVSSKGKTVYEVKTEVINESICSDATLQKAKLMLEGVVNNNGTAANLKNSHYRVAGKTGMPEEQLNEFAGAMQNRLA